MVEALTLMATTSTFGAVALEVLEVAKEWLRTPSLEVGILAELVVVTAVKADR